MKVKVLNKLVSLGLVLMLLVLNASSLAWAYDVGSSKGATLYTTVGERVETDGLTFNATGILVTLRNVKAADSMARDKAYYDYLATAGYGTSREGVGAAAIDSWKSFDKFLAETFKSLRVTGNVLTLSNRYLDTFPNFLNTPDMAQQALLVIRGGSSTIENARDRSQTIVYCNNEAQHIEYVQYSESRPADVAGFDIAKDAITADAELLQKFKNKSLSYDEVKPKRNLNRLKTWVAAYPKIFANSATIDTDMHQMLYGASGDMDLDAGEDKQVEYGLRYLDMLILINEMCGGQHQAVIENYLKTLNRSDTGSDENLAYSTIFMAAVASYGDNDVWTWYTLPRTYAEITTGAKLEDFNSISLNAEDGTKFGDNRAANIANIWDQYNSIINAKGNWKSSAVCVALRKFCLSAWWTSAQGNPSGLGNWEWAVACLPTDWKGKASGGVGYTYFSTMCHVESSANASITCSLTTESEKKEIKNGETATAVSEVRIKKDEQSDWQVYLDSVTSKDNKFNFEVYLKAERTVGKGENEKFFDKVEAKGFLALDESKTKKTEKSEERVYNWKGVTYAQIKPYLEGETALMTITDKDVTIEVNESATKNADQTTNKYSLWIIGKEVTASGALVGEAKYYAATGEEQAELATAPPGNKVKEIAFDYANWTAVEEVNASAGVFLSITPKQSKIAKGAKAEATVDITASVPEGSTTIKDLDAIYRKAGTAGVTLIVELWANKKDGADGPIADYLEFYDQLVKPSGWTSVANGKGKQTITISKIDDKVLKKLLQGKTIIQFKDKNITVAEGEDGSKVWYYVRMSIKYGSEKLYFQATGKSTKKSPKDYKYNNVAYAKQKFVMVDDPPKEDPPVLGKSHYYSEMEDPYVEIKEGSPGAESFEAMAGVPTTENLYVGFGGTEFMTNLDVEEKINPDTTRTYTLTHICTACAHNDDKCTYSCPGHFISDWDGGCGKLLAAAVPPSGDDPGKPAKYCTSGSHTTWNCTAGSGTSTTKCDCGAKSKTSSTYVPTLGVGYSECIGFDGSLDSEGYGCVHIKPFANTTHVHTHVFTGTITQKINTFRYVDITNMALWQLNKFTFEGNPDLLSNPNCTLPANLGYTTFYTQENYVNNNGRLDFSFRWEEGQRYGNTNISYTDGTQYPLTIDADTAATQWMNDQVQGQVVTTTVVSDYEILTTSEGYQVPLYHEYKADTVPVAAEAFTVGSDSKPIKGGDVTFSTKPTWSDFWTGNPQSAATWSPKGLLRSGYNGRYSPWDKKYNNNYYLGSYSTQTNNPQEWLTGHPNVLKTPGDTAFTSTGFSNIKFTRTGFNIIDSTNVATKAWSATDSTDPIHNGIWNTGEAYVDYTRKIIYKAPGGTDYSTFYEADGIDLSTGLNLKLEVGYAPGQSTINDIVVYDPVSTKDAVVIKNDDKYDLRSVTSLAAGGDPEALALAVCPRNENCDNQSLKGQSQVEWVKNFAYTGGEQSITLQAGIYKLEAYGAAAGDGCAGGYTSAILTITEPRTLHVYAGAQGKSVASCVASAETVQSYVFNGGGDGNTLQVEDSGGHRGAGGGGATDFRLVGGSWAESESLKSRILVAGGAGGSGCASKLTDKGVGGGLIGGTTYNIQPTYYGYIATGGTQTAGGTGFRDDIPITGGHMKSGSFGFGANAAWCAAGGGGGYYGGGSCYTAGGGGGSSYVSGVTGCDTTYLANQGGVVFTNAIMQQGVNTGNGKAVISKLTDADCLPSEHGLDCYMEVSNGIAHSGGLNTHVCTEACQATATHTHTASCYSGGTPYWTARMRLTGNISIYGAYAVCGTCNTWYVCSNAVNPMPYSVLEYMTNCGYCGSSRVSKGIVSTSSYLQAGTYCCQYFNSTLTCGLTETAATNTITLPMSFPGIGWVGCVSGYEHPVIHTNHTYAQHIHPSTCGYPSAVHLFDVTANTCVSCDHQGCRGTISGSVTGSQLLGAICTEELNTHVCTAACVEDKELVCVCTNPHHYEKGEVYDGTLATSHWSYGDPRCWKACCDDTKHNAKQTVTLGSGQVINTSDVFINLDREFRIYYPDVGDFAQDPSMHGIGSPSMTRGMGYTDNMDVAKWMREKFVTFPVDVIWYSNSGEPQSFPRGTPINLNKLTYDAGGEGFYTFYCVLCNNELMNASVEFDAIAVNAIEVEYLREDYEIMNLYRRSGTFANYHTAYKSQLIDVLGSIGSLTIEDTGDPRFATIFKQPLNTDVYGWLIENVVPKVNYSAPRTIVSDSMNVKQDLANASTNYQSAYGKTYAAAGGKAHEFNKLPLTAAYNPIPALKTDELRPGYRMYMDFETIGDYYGENRNMDGQLQDSNLYYKAQVTPRYWQLNLNAPAGVNPYTPVDVYMLDLGSYVPINFFTPRAGITENYSYVNWLKEMGRRNYTLIEQESTVYVSEKLSFPGMERVRYPLGEDIIGTAQRLFLNDLNRTFIGGTTTYDVNRNPNNMFYPTYYYRQSQRWHYTVGLPSSTVFIHEGDPCTTANIDEMKASNSVIVCTLDIIIKGNVWTMQYDGTNINGDGLVVRGKKYPLPTEPGGGTFTDVIATVYDPKYTSADDFRGEGTH